MNDGTVGDTKVQQATGHVANTARDRGMADRPPVVGDYVIARLLVDPPDTRQGLIIAHYGQTMVVLGELDTYACSTEGATMVPDKNLDGGTLAWVHAQRRERKL